MATVLCDGVLPYELVGRTAGSVVQVGGDIGLHVGKNFIDSFPDRVVKSQLIPLLNEAGRLGEKTGSGFYKYTNRKQAPDPAVKEILYNSRAAAGLSQACILSRSISGITQPFGCSASPERSVHHTKLLAQHCCKYIASESLVGA